MAARTNKVELTERWKNGMAATMLLKRLNDHALGKLDLTSEQVRSADVVLKKLVPDLASVEQTIHDERDNADPMALYSQMIAALAANPALLDRLIAAVHAHRASSATLVADAGAQQSGK